MNKLYLIISILILYSCSNKPAIILTGTLNLNNKEKILITGTSNRNDVLKILGPSIIRGYPDENKWVYFEQHQTKNLFGKNKITKNDLLIINFDNKGLIIKKKLFDIKNNNEIELSEEITKTFAIEETLAKKFFSSMRKRIENKMMEKQSNYN